MRRIAVVTPILDDWQCFGRLVADLACVASDAGIIFDVVAVDDGSVHGTDFELSHTLLRGPIRRIEIVRLTCNLGHQRAIAVGLAHVAERDDIDNVLVMDGDGEDRPADVSRLIAAAYANPGSVIFAGRTKRSEPGTFQLGYLTYKVLFRVLTGHRINFGNFSLLPAEVVSRLCHMPEVWNNFAAATIRSRLPWAVVPTERGRRYAGRSRMNYLSLVTHGLSALSVYTDLIFVRILFGCALVAGATVLGIVVAIAVRLATSLAIPGWTTNVVAALTILLFQTGMLMVATTLMLLSARSNRPMIPAADAVAFIRDIRQWRAPFDEAASEFVE